MAEMGQYCKAYLAKDLRQFPGWTENQANVRKEKKEEGGKEVEVDRELDDESILYIQENYVVTDGIFKDENIIFDNVTDEWKRFCHETLEFEIPVYEPIEIPTAEAPEGQPAAAAGSEPAPSGSGQAAAGSDSAASSSDSQATGSSSAASGSGQPPSGSNPA